MTDDPHKEQREGLPEVTPEARAEWRATWRESAGLTSDGWANVAAALLDALDEAEQRLAESRKSR